MKPRIILMDDSPMILEVAAMVLEEAGYEVLLALTVADLDRHCAKGRPDLLILDVNMPEAFGDDIAAVLRGLRGLDAPILLYSNIDESSLATRAFDAGVNGYVCKQAGLPALLHRVQDLIGAGAA
jgi:DNA-binding response OmpR family regulator